MKYSMHNIILPDGNETMPGKPILAETEDVREMIDFAKKNGFKEVVDLGSGEGGYAIAFARAGFPVIAVEPRFDNVNKIKLAKEPINDIIIIERTTVTDYLLNKHYPFFKGNTLFLCLGLLYHLSNPADILADISQKGDGLILSTHYALEKHWQYDYVTPAGSWILKRICKRFPKLFSFTHYGLSRLTMLKGHYGRWYREFPKGYKNSMRLSHSSLYNDRSFWLTRKSINEICQKAGLTCVFTKERSKGQSFTSFWLKK